MGQWVAASSSSAIAQWGHGKQLGTKQMGGRRQAVLQGVGGKSPINQEILCCEIAFPCLGQMQMIDKIIFVKQYLSLVMASSRSGKKLSIARKKGRQGGKRRENSASGEV